MMNVCILLAVTGIYLLCAVALVNAADNWQSKILFKALPQGLGTLCLIFALAIFMKWPLPT